LFHRSLHNNNQHKEFKQQTNQKISLFKNKFSDCTQAAEITADQSLMAKEIDLTKCETKHELHVKYVYQLTPVT